MDSLFMRKHCWQIIGALCLISALWLTITVCRFHILGMDTAVYGWITTHVMTSGMTSVMRVLTQLSGSITVIIVAAVTLAVLATMKRWKIGVAVAVNLAVIYVLNEIIKHIVRRPRPDFPHLVFEQGYSFPSGHAMVSTAFYGFIAYLLHRYWHTARNSGARVWKIVAITLLCLIPPVVMFTRVYLGVHYASDVCAGFLFAIAWLVLCYVPAMKRTLLKRTTPANLPH